MLRGSCTDLADFGGYLGIGIRRASTWAQEKRVHYGWLSELLLAGDGEHDITW